MALQEIRGNWAAFVTLGVAPMIGAAIASANLFAGRMASLLYVGAMTFAVGVLARRLASNKLPQLLARQFGHRKL